MSAAEPVPLFPGIKSEFGEKWEGSGQCLGDAPLVRHCCGAELWKLPNDSRPQIIRRLVFQRAVIRIVHSFPFILKKHHMLHIQNLLLFHSFSFHLSVLTVRGIL